MKGKYGDFYRSTFCDSFRYCSLRIPEVSDDIYKIDDAICSGFGWKFGPFQTWDILGVKETVSIMESLDLKPANWVYAMLKEDFNSFYRYKNNIKEYYDIHLKKYCEIPGSSDLIILDGFKENNVVWENEGTTLYDIGDGILNLEFHTKMNTMGKEVLDGINEYLQKMPDNQNMNTIRQIDKKSSILHLGCELKKFDMYKINQNT